VGNSILDAIKNGEWDFEPGVVEEKSFDSTYAMPGSNEKVETLATRLRKGLPLWHSSDRRSYDDSDQAYI
jgi:hypothetical protein